MNNLIDKIESIKVEVEKALGSINNKNGEFYKLFNKVKKAMFSDSKSFIYNGEEYKVDYSDTDSSFSSDNRTIYLCPITIDSEIAHETAHLYAFANLNDISKNYIDNKSYLLKDSEIFAYTIQIATFASSKTISDIINIYFNNVEYNDSFKIYNLFLDEAEKYNSINCKMYMDEKLKEEDYVVWELFDDDED